MMNHGPWIVICGVRSLVWAYRIRRGKQVLGRHIDCDIRIEHRSVSRHHAEITFDGTEMMIVDQRSANGTYLNGNAVRRAAFEVGDTIRVGRVALEVLATRESIRMLDEDDEGTERSLVDRPDAVEAISAMLSPADNKVLKLLLEGQKERAIASRLQISQETVHWRVKRIYKTLGVHSRTELFALLRK